MGLIIRSLYQEISGGQSARGYDKTKPYNATYNQGGWGSPNVDASGILLDNLIVTIPDVNTLLPSGTPITLPLTPAIPYISNVDPNAYVTINPSDLGFTTTFQDGWYLFNRNTTTNDGVPYSTFDYVMFTGVVDCCLQNLNTKAQIMGNGGCSCDSDINQLILDKILYSAALCAAVNCQDIANGAKYLKQLQAICAQAQCCV